MLAVLAFALLLAACGSANAGGAVGAQTPTLASKDIIITLERTICFGRCPAYRLTIQGDGTVTYVGEKFVKVEGIQTTRISKDQVQQLLAEFERIRYFDLKDDYTDRYITDLPSAITSLTLGDRTKKINHYYGDKSAPAELKNLEDQIDQIVNTAQWTR